MRPARIVALVAGLLYAAFALAQADDEDPLARVKARGSIEFALYSEFPPYSYADANGAPAGIDVDVARALAARMGLAPRFRLFEAQEDVGDDLRNVVWKGHYLAGGVSDVMLHVAFDRGYAAKETNAWLFRPYFHETVCVIFKPGTIKNFESPMALAGHRVAVQGDTISDYLVSSAFNGVLRTSAVRGRSLDEAVAALGSGEADAAMAPRGELQGLMKLHGVDIAGYERHDLIGMFRTSWDVGMAVKNPDGNTSLRDAVTAAMDALAKDGELERIFRAHGVDYAAPPPVPQ